MKWTVLYRPTADKELTTLWIEAPDRADMTDAANKIDKLLGTNPLTVGSALEGGGRILVVAPLAVNYDVIPDDCQVMVWQVWRWDMFEDEDL